MGFNMLFYIIFGTNQLTRGPVPVSVFFAYFRVSQKKNIKRSPNGMKPSRGSFLDRTQSRRLGVEVWNSTRRPRGWWARPGGQARHPPSWAPRSSTDVLLPPIYSQISQNHQREPRNHFSTAATFCTREIPSVDLFRHPVGGGFDHGGLLHQHHCPSDEA